MAIDTPTYDIAKFLVPISKPLTENEYTVHDSFSLANEVMKFNSKNLMANLHVESLFTSILLEETIDNTIYHSSLTSDKIHNFEREELKQLPTFAAYESFFIFDGEYYTQIDGLALGTIWAQHLLMLYYVILRKKFSECPAEFFPNVYKRYVDDIFVTFRPFNEYFAHAGTKLSAQVGFFKNSPGNLLQALRFLGRLYNFCNFIIIFF